MFTELNCFCFCHCVYRFLQIINKHMSTIHTNFPESAMQSSSPELSGELTAALTVSSISEEPEYGDLSSVQWWGTMESSVISEKAESPPSGFLDATWSRGGRRRHKVHPCFSGPNREHHAATPLLKPAQHYMTINRTM